MNTATRKWVNPFRWLLFLMGWTFGARYVKDDKLWRWGLHRVNDDIYDGRYDMGPAKDGKQRLVHISSETYWFGRPTRQLAATWLVCEDKRTLKVRLGIPFICMHYMRFSWHRTCWFAKLLRGKYPNDLEYGLGINSSALSWYWGQDTMGWASDGSTGYHFYFPWDKFRERGTYEEIVYWTVDRAFVQPPYGARPASDHVMTITFSDTKRTYKRPWNRNRVDFYAKIDFPSPAIAPHRPPAFSGKGESSHDCGDDGIYGCSIPIPDVITWSGLRSHGITKQEIFNHPEPAYREDILRYVTNKYIEMVEKNRKRYG